MALPGYFTPTPGGMAQSNATGTAPALGNPGPPPSNQVTPPGPNKPNNPTAILQFIEQWQNTHSPTEGIGPLVAALQQAGYDVGPFMYNGTPSNNELLINGQKWKVLGGEGTAGAYWYKPGMDDGGGGSSGGGLFGNAPFLGAIDTFQIPTLEQYLGSPGVQVGLDRIQELGESGAAARGTLFTGGFQQDLGEQMLNYAEGGYRDYLNTLLGVHMANAGIQEGNMTRPFNMLLSASGLGLQGVNQLSNASQNTTGNVAETILGQGNAGAAGTIGGANATSGTPGALGALGAAGLGTAIDWWNKYRQPGGSPGFGAGLGS